MHAQIATHAHVASLGMETGERTHRGPEKPCVGRSKNPCKAHSYFLLKASISPFEQSREPCGGTCRPRPPTRSRPCGRPCGLDACSTFMNGLNVHFGEVADRCIQQCTGAATGANVPEKVPLCSAARTRIPAFAIPSENGPSSVLYHG